MQRKILSLFVMVLMVCGVRAISRQQLKKSLQMLKKQCIGKTGVAEDKIVNIEKGQFVEEKEVMCYIACIYQLTNIVKNNKISYEASLKQIDIMYPQDVKEPAKKACEHCKDVSKKYKDLCEGSYWTAKCMYEDDPANFIFP